jgi:long-chain acyl-CoA synthetase
VDPVVHCAASVQFTLPLEDARRINVGGTREMVALAERAPALDRFVHVSTAYVAGDRGGTYFEHESDIGQPPRNTYEQTKLEAEALVDASGLPAATLRPSIVVGDSRTGWTPAFNVIYWPLQAFARGLFPVVPADPDSRADIVPVDMVADALFELATGERQAGVIHAVAGDDASSAADLAGLAADAFGADRPRFVAPGEAPEAEERAGAYLPYFRVCGTFDAARGRALGFRAPPLPEYFAALMAYARDARWGKRPRRRWEVEADLVPA